MSGKWEVFGTDKYTVSGAGNKTVQSVQIAYKKLTTTGAMSGALQLRFTVSDAGKKLVDEPDTYNGEEITDEVIAMLARNSREVPFAMPMNNVMPMASTTGNRPAGVASFAVNFEPGGQAPLDARQPLFQTRQTLLPQLPIQERILITACWSLLEITGTANRLCMS